MATRSVKRVCPYCGTILLLEALPLVCTARGLDSAVAQVTWDDTDASSSVWDPPSGAPSHGTLGAFPVLREANLTGSKVVKAMTRLQHPSEVADPRDMPRRACTACLKALPEELDECDALLLAVVGLNRAGKTYFLGSSLNGATRFDGLADYGVELFEPLEETASVLHKNYYQPLFHRHERLPITPVMDHVERPPLVFRVKLTGLRPFLLFTHDISGEALVSNQTRHVTASFLRRANAMIFITDPLDVEYIEWNLAPEEVEEAGGGLRDLNQTALLEALLRELPTPGGGKTPHLAVALSKSDLIEKATGRKYRFSEPPSPGDWRDDVRQVNEEIRELLTEMGESKLLRLSDGYPRTSFHAMSVLGRESDRERRHGRPVPLRVMDPLATVLEAMRPMVGAE
ncbi:hypothetical protein [Leekyejoonella antrihumi]|uniref:Uncharacterized protein n=1 Tax=Leekyejoonella antrihumi TaxID=1660198 RepID=A0A563DS45_9MICO|nr:hypothetical protein [Leekyejoonella antrihumi]TWP32996.1 hypothetical protein FGL98_22640 [Leekyejoonella antrihumi]